MLSSGAQGSRAQGWVSVASAHQGLAVKVRIGLGTGGAGLDPSGLDALAGDVLELGFDSLWMPEVLSAPGFDPLVGLAWVAGRRPSLKVGTTMLLPGRNVARTAKQIATLDVLSAGRFLVTFVPGLPAVPSARPSACPPSSGARPWTRCSRCFAVCGLVRRSPTTGW